MYYITSEYFVNILTIILNVLGIYSKFITTLESRTLKVYFKNLKKVKKLKNNFLMLLP